MFTYSNGYWEVYRRFQGGFFGLGGGGLRGGIMQGELSMEKFVMGKNISMKGVQDFFLAFFKEQ